MNKVKTQLNPHFIAGFTKEAAALTRAQTAKDLLMDLINNPRAREVFRRNVKHKAGKAGEKVKGTAKSLAALAKNYKENPRYRDMLRRSFIKKDQS